MINGDGDIPASTLTAILFIIILELIGAVLSSVIFRRVYMPTYLSWKKKMMEE